MFKTCSDWLLNKIGYFRDEEANKLIEEYREIIRGYYYQNTALLEALGAAEEKSQSDNIIKSCLMVLLNKEEVVMKIPFINEVSNMNMSIQSVVNENNDIVLTLVQNETEDTEPVFTEG